jgi:hypothetical protein
MVDPESLMPPNPAESLTVKAFVPTVTTIPAVYLLHFVQIVVLTALQRHWRLS